MKRDELTFKQIAEAQHRQATGIEGIAADNFVGKQTMEVSMAAIIYSEEEDDDDDSGFSCPCCLPR